MRRRQRSPCPSLPRQRGFGSNVRTFFEQFATICVVSRAADTTLSELYGECFMKNFTLGASVAGRCAGRTADARSQKRVARHQRWAGNGDSVQLAVICVAAAVTLAGCGTGLPGDPDIAGYSANNVIRMSVFWPEKAKHDWNPPFYNVEAARNHWTPEDNQYRWIIAHASFRKDFWGMSDRVSLVPDSVPFLESGDLVDVYDPGRTDVDYGNFKAPIVLRLVCKHKDKACIEASKKELGGLNEIASKGKPGLSDLIFSKTFDIRGNRLKPIESK
ncbi:protein of unknown function [Burkholderia multivorans]